MDWTLLPEETRAMLRRVAMPDYVEWDRQIRATGACSNPIRMRGGREIRDANTGELLDAFHTDASPVGYLLIPCGNRRASLCPSCSEVYRYDAYQLIRAGLAGGKGVPESVALHPALFVTLTAPSFGAVHARHKQTGKDGLPLRCRPRTDAVRCRHGVTMACFQRHEYGDASVGHALCVDCYDYFGAVLFNIHAGVLWRRLSIYVRREVAKAVGIHRSKLDTHARLSFVKVAEYQARGVVHFHAVLRLDGAEGPDTTPPSWATVELLDACLRAALAQVGVDVPDPAACGRTTRRMQFGGQVDTQVIHATAEHRAEGLTTAAVAGYIAKYATKAAESTGTVERRIKNERDLEFMNLPEHVLRMLRACFEVSSTSGLEYVNPYRTAHMLGYGGHCTTKSRRYSTTFGSLRGQRRAHREEERRALLGLPSLDARDLVVRSDWHFLRAGLAYGEEPLVAAIHDRQRLARALRGKDPA